MPRFRLPGRFHWAIAVTSIVAISGLFLVSRFVSSDPVKQGWAAYARGDWEVAAEQARQRLKAAAYDIKRIAAACPRIGSTGT